MTKRTYHGWIYIDREEGYNDFFRVQYYDKEHNTVVASMGYGAIGAAAAVEFFEATRKLGHVLLEETPLGLRVFTQEEEG